MKVEMLSLGELQTNCYILYEEASPDAVVIDPGDEAERILARLTEKNLRLAWVLLTHGHYDHMMAADKLLDATGASFGVPGTDLPLLTDPALNCCASLHRGDFTVSHRPDRLIHEGDTIICGKLEITVLETPGHTAGSVTYRVGNALFTGDLLFYQMIGRIDLPTGSYNAMKRSLTRIGRLEDDFVIYPGHSIATTLSHERESNIYLKHLLNRKAE